MIKLEKPTVIAAIAYFIMGVIVLLPLNIGEYDPAYNTTQKFDLSYRILLLLILLVPIVLSLYSINCMVKGKCVVWSYVNAVLICVWVVLFTAGSVYASRKKQTT